MGWRLVRRHKHPPCAGATPLAAPGRGWHLRQALAMSLTNPKVILFCFTLLSLFVRAPLNAASFGTMVVCVSGISLLYQGALVLLGFALRLLFA